MKKMMSLAAMFAVLAYASPASAELKLGGDASVRMRGQFEDFETNGTQTNNDDDINFAYRLRLKGSADLGNGYFVKTLVTTEANATGAAAILSAGGWNTVGASNTENPTLSISQLYFGRMMENSHYMMGRLPLNSANNPIFDLALYPIPALNIGIADQSVATYNMDRVYGFNYGAKLLGGEANATLVVFDNNTKDDSAAEGDGVFNDGYALHLAYKTKIGNVTVEPQAVIALTDVNGRAYTDVSPNTFGANLTIPAGEAKIGLSGFYTVCDDTNPNTKVNVDYSGYLVRVKGEVGNFMAYVDYNQTEDKTVGHVADYDNLFVWAQYNFKAHESAAGSFTLSPIVRYWAAGDESGATETDYSRLRTELVATVTF